MIALLSKLLTHPFVGGILVPAISKAMVEFFDRQANRIEERAAVKAAKAAKTAEELRHASKLLSDASDRR